MTDRTKTHPIILRQGDTTTVSVELSEALPDGYDLKMGIYTPNGRPLHEATVSGGGIAPVDGTHLVWELGHDVTRRMAGAATLRAAVIGPGLSTVNAAENALPLYWEREPVTSNI